MLSLPHSKSIDDDDDAYDDDDDDDDDDDNADHTANENERP